MNRYLIPLAAFVLQVSCLLRADQFSAAADQLIADITRSSEFRNALVQYPFEDSSYAIRIVHNPEKKPLWGKRWSSPRYNALTLIANLPPILVNHVRGLVKGVCQPQDDPSFYFKGHYIELPANPRFCSLEEGWDSAEVVHIAETIEDPIADAIAQNVFSSTKFVNQVLYYHLDGFYHRVRLLHNPNGRVFSARKKYQLESYGEYTHTLYWNYKFGIFTLRPDDDRLIDHLSRLTNASYLEWYLNFDVSNGKSETFEFDKGQYTYSYWLDTKFEYAEDFH